MLFLIYFNFKKRNKYQYSEEQVMLLSTEIGTELLK